VTERRSSQALTALATGATSSGLLQGVERLLGHRARGCRTCGGGQHGEERRLLLGMLAAADRGAPGRLALGIGLAWRTSRR
jgi:hypothetical protein